MASAPGAEVRELNELKQNDALALLAAYARRRVDALPEDRWPVHLDQIRNAELDYLEARTAVELAAADQLVDRGGGELQGGRHLPDREKGTLQGLDPVTEVAEGV